MLPPTYKWEKRGSERQRNLLMLVVVVHKRQIPDPNTGLNLCLPYETITFSLQFLVSPITCVPTQSSSSKTPFNKLVKESPSNWWPAANLILQVKTLHVNQALSPALFGAISVPIASLVRQQSELSFAFLWRQFRIWKTSIWKTYSDLSCDT